jgi:hypothetical protein
MNNSEEKCWWIREGIIECKGRVVGVGPYASREESEAELAELKQDARYREMNFHVEASPARPKQNPLAG